MNTNTKNTKRKSRPALSLLTSLTLLFASSIAFADDYNADENYSSGNISADITTNYDNVYGVSGETQASNKLTLSITGATIAESISVASGNATVAGKTVFTVEGASAKNIYGATGTSELNNSLTMKVTDATVSESIYGVSGDSDLNSSLTMTVTDSGVSGDISAVSGEAYAKSSVSLTVSGEDATVQNIYGASAFSVLDGSLAVTVTDATVSENIYAATDDATVAGKTTFTIEGASAKNIYGATGTSELNNSLTMKVTDATVSESIYGVSGYSELNSSLGLTVTDTGVSGDISAASDSAYISGSVSLTVSGEDSSALNIYGTTGTSKIGSTLAVKVTDAIVAENIYATSGATTVASNATLTVEDVSVKNIYGAAGTSIISGTFKATITDAEVSESISIVSDESYVDGKGTFKISGTTVAENIYGVSDAATVDADVEFNITNTSAQNIYGVDGSSTKADGSSTSVNGSLEMTVTDSEVSGDVSAVSGKVYVKSAVSLELSGETTSVKNIYGASGDSELGSSLVVTVADATVAENIYAVTGDATVAGRTTFTVEGVSAKNIYGANGTSELNNSLIINVTDTTLSGNIYAVSDSAYLGNSVTLNVSGTTSALDIYGITDKGTAGTLNLTLSDSVSVSNVYGAYGVGTLVTANNNVNVTINGGTVSNDVYGVYGDAIISSGVVLTVSSGEIGGDVYAVYGDTASGEALSVNGVTLKISGGEIEGDAYLLAGETIAGSNSSIVMTNGSVAGSVYGATGNTTTAEGTLSIHVTEGSVVNGSVYLLTDSAIGKTTNNNIVVSDSSVTNDVYLLSDYATASNSSIRITSSTVGGSVYGVSDSALVTGALKIYLGNDNEAEASVGGSVYGLTGNANSTGGIDLYMYEGFTIDNDISILSGESTLESNSTINIYGGTVGGSVYGASDSATTTKVLKIFLYDGATVEASIYGATDSANTSSPRIYIYGGTVGENVYLLSGTASTSSAIFFEIEGGIVEGSVYGVTGGASAEDVSATVTFSGGTVCGDVYGVTDTVVTTTDGVTEDTATPLIGGIHFKMEETAVIEGDAYLAQGNLSISGNIFQDSVGVLINAANINTTGGTIEGNLYGLVDGASLERNNFQVSIVDTTIGTSSDASSGNFYALSNGSSVEDGDMTVYLTDSTFYGEVAFVSDDSLLNGELSVYINGGTFYGDIYLGADDSSQITASATLTITGSVDFVADEDGYLTIYAGEADGGTTLNILGGYVNADDDESKSFDANLIGFDLVNIVDSIYFADGVDLSGSTINESDVSSADISGTTGSVTLTDYNKVSIDDNTTLVGTVTLVNADDVSISSNATVSTSTAFIVSSTADAENSTTTFAGTTSFVDGSSYDEDANVITIAAAKTAVETDSTTTIAGNVSTTYDSEALVSVIADAQEAGEEVDVSSYLTALKTTDGVVNLEDGTTVSSELTVGDATYTGVAITNVHTEDAEGNPAGLTINVNGSVEVDGSIVANSPLKFTTSGVSGDGAGDGTEIDSADITVKGGVVTTNYSADSTTINSDVTIDGVAVYLTTNAAGVMSYFSDIGDIEFENDGSLGIAGSAQMLVNASYNIVNGDKDAYEALSDWNLALTESKYLEYSISKDEVENTVTVAVEKITYFQETQATNSNEMALAIEIDCLEASTNSDEILAAAENSAKIDFKNEVEANGLSSYIMSANSYIAEVNTMLLSNMNVANVNRARSILEKSAGVQIQDEDGTVSFENEEGEIEIVDAESVSLIKYSNVAQLQSINLLGSKDASNGVAGYDYWSVGSTANFDEIFSDKLLIGASIGGTYNKVVGDAGDNANSTTFLVNAYAAYANEGFEAFGNIGYAHFWNEGSKAGAGSADWDSDAFNYLFGISYDLETTVDGLTITPLAMFNLVYLNSDSAKYSNGVTVDSQDYFSAKLMLGLEVEYAITAQFNAIIRAMYAHEMGDTSYDNTYSLSFVNGVNYIGSETGADSAVMGLGLSYDFSETCTMYFDYNAYVYSNLITHSLNLSLALKF